MSPSPVTHDEAPEQYWVRRGTNVIGDGSLTELRRCRQLATYRTIAELLGIGSSVTMGGATATWPEPLLDLGCNVGALGQLLRDWGHQGSYLGLDRNPHALSRARLHLGRQAPALEHCFLQGNIRALPLADRSIVNVVMKDVLEHLEGFRAALGEALRVAATTLVVASYLPWHDAAARYHRDPRGFYENTYRRADVLAFVTRCGWQLSESRAVSESDGRPNEVMRFSRRA